MKKAPQQRDWDRTLKSAESGNRHLAVNPKEKGTEFDDRGSNFNPPKAVCKKCHMVMPDAEPMSPSGEFWHLSTHADGTKSKCPNRDKVFYRDSPEVEPFMRKRERRQIERIKKSL